MTTAMAERTVAPESAPRHRKALMFCHDCGFRSPVLDGDWLVTERTVADTAHRVYECPDCWQTVLDQPVLD